MRIDGECPPICTGCLECEEEVGFRMDLERHNHDLLLWISSFSRARQSVLQVGPGDEGSNFLVRNLQARISANMFAERVHGDSESLCKGVRQ